MFGEDSSVAFISYYHKTLLEKVAALAVRGDAAWHVEVARCHPTPLEERDPMDAQPVESAPAQHARQAAPRVATRERPLHHHRAVLPLYVSSKLPRFHAVRDRLALKRRDEVAFRAHRGRV